MPIPLLRRAIRRRHSAVDEERGGCVVARHILGDLPGACMHTYLILSWIYARYSTVLSC